VTCVSGCAQGSLRLSPTAGGTGPGQNGDAEDLRRNLQERLQKPIEPVDASRAATLTDRITVSPALLDTLAPLVGLLLRGRAAA